jgi:cell division protein FtsL
MSGWSVFIRQTTATCLLLAVALAVILLTIKHQVRALNEELGSLNRQIVRERESIQVLQAEFAYLAQPERLRRLAVGHLGLAPSEPRQLATFASLDASLAALAALPAKAPKQAQDSRAGVHVAQRNRGQQR